MHELASAESAAQCDVCDAPLRAAARFCTSCGSSVDVPDIPPRRRLPAPPLSIDATVARRWRELKRVGSLFGLLLASSFVLGIVSRFDASPWPDAIVSVVDAVLVFGFVITRLRQMTPLLALPRVDARSAVELVLASIGFALMLGVYFALLTYIGVPMVDLTQDYEKAHWPLWSMFALVSVLPAVVEELAFRGVIQSSLEEVGSDLEAWLIQAALFSVLHLSPIIFPSHFAMGLWFGWLRRRTQSVYPGMVMHGLWNGIVLSAALQP